MLKRPLSVLLWTAAFFVGSLVLLFAGFFFLGLYHSRAEDPSSITFSQFWQFTPLLGAAIGFVLGALGKLPGTRSQRAR
jgi:hypothetical protein